MLRAAPAPPRPACSGSDVLGLGAAYRAEKVIVPLPVGSLSPVRVSWLVGCWGAERARGELRGGGPGSRAWLRLRLPRGVAVVRASPEMLRLQAADAVEDPPRCAGSDAGRESVQTNPEPIREERSRETRRSSGPSSGRRLWAESCPELPPSAPGTGVPSAWQVAPPPRSREQ